MDISEFEIGDFSELPGLEILMVALGEEKVVDVEASNRGLADKGIIRVRVKCAIQFEKGLRSQIKKLVRQSTGAGNMMTFETSEGVRIHSLHTIRSLEGERVGVALHLPRWAVLSPEDRLEVRRKEAILYSKISKLTNLSLRRCWNRSLIRCSSSRSSGVHMKHGIVRMLA